MSLKENMKAIKEELNSEEKFLESAIRTERFVKRYQKPLIVLVVGSLLAVAGAIGYQSYTNAKIESSNVALNVLLTNPTDKTAEQTLKNDNPDLYDLWKLSRAITNSDVTALEELKNSQAFGIGDIASYETAVIKGDTGALDQYTKKQGAFYKDLVLVELAVMLIEKGEVKTARQKMAQIDENSPLYPAAQALSHYGMKQ